MVAMLIFAIVAMTALSLIVSALSATARARTEGVAKNLGQERLETMRNLPYSVSASVSTSVQDLLDIYYTSTSTAAPNTASTGYVSATGARDVSKGDPASGAFFRRIIADADIDGFARFSQRVTAQFMKDQSTVLPPTTFISSSTSTDGLPPASTIAVTVTTLWEANGKPQRFTVYSQIAEATNKPPLVTLQARLSTLRFSGVLPNARELVAEAGVVNLDGSLSNSTSASAVAQGGMAAIANGARVDGAKESLAAPPDATKSDVSAGVRTLTDGSSTVAQLSNSSLHRQLHRGAGKGPARQHDGSNALGDVEARRQRRRHHRSASDGDVAGRPAEGHADVLQHDL
jgi:type II secretory pathway pseudopilin PulG